MLISPLKAWLRSGHRQICLRPRQSIISFVPTTARPVGPTRHYSSSADNAVPGSQRSSRILLVLASLVSGAVGYTVAQRQTIAAAAEDKDAEPKFGTPDDFKQAIAELRLAFIDEDDVSTDIEDLEAHGLSVYDHHPGAAIRYHTPKAECECASRLCA